MATDLRGGSWGDGGPSVVASWVAEGEAAWERERLGAAGVKRRRRGREKG
jgi:hypothetical protein